MRVLLVGGGGREHAIAEALARGGAELYAVMRNRNPGIARLSREFLLADETDGGRVAGFGKRVGAEMAVIGPEGPLAGGVADALAVDGIPTVGPTKRLAQIEASKAFMRGLMARHKIPGSLRYGAFSGLAEALDFLERFDGPVAIKPSGLTGGKGVKVVGDQLKDLEEARDYLREVMEGGIGGGEVVIEERADGEEFTLQAFVDGKRVVPMPLVQDHKRAFEGDVGPNTGGMGAYSDADGLLPFLEARDRRAAETIMKAAVAALKAETGEEYRGILYGQFMLGRELRLIEFNCRFGDPEAMNVLSILKTNFVEVCQGIVEGRLRDAAFEPKATVSKYVVPKGYGLTPMSGKRIFVDEERVRKEGAILYYAAVNEDGGAIYTTSSRSVGVVGVHETIAGAERIAERAVEGIRGEGIYHRADIGTEALIKRKMMNLQRIR